VPKSVLYRHDDIKYNLSKERKRLMKNRFCEKRKAVPSDLQQGATGQVVTLIELRDFWGTIIDRQKTTLQSMITARDDLT